MADDTSNLTRRGLVSGLAAGAALLPAAASALPDPREKVAKWDEEADVIVIGFGVSGAAATYEAMKSGARVIVLDRGAAAANESHGGYHYMGGGTPLQKAYGVEDSPEEMEKYLLATTGPDPDTARVRLYVERSLDNYRWLEEIGVTFSPDRTHEGLIYLGNEIAWPTRERARPAMRSHRGWQSGNGKWIQKTLLDKTAATGARQYLAADAERLVQGADGAIQGVTALIDGKRRALRARRGVILATGGFALNREMVAQYLPDMLDVVPIDVGSNDGWGIRAGRSVGAALRRMASADITWPLYPPDSRKQGMLVNRLGQRFMPEDSYYGVTGYEIVRHQNGIAHLIVDRTALGGVTAADKERKSIKLQDVSAAEAERALGIPEPALQQAIDNYNRYAAKGQDPFFHKTEKYLRPLTPPFTVIKASLAEATIPFFTLGGLHTSLKAEVLNDEGSVIPHLYAVGRTVAGVPCPNYFSSGLSLGECVCFGRIAGATAARA